MPIKLLVACRETLWALPLCTKIIHAAGGRIAGEATDLFSVLRRAAATRPDVLLLEHTQGEEESAWHVLSRLGLVSANTRVVLLCDAYTHLMIAGFVQRGASGCLLKSVEPSLCAKAVSTVHAGDTWFGRAALVQALRSQAVAESVLSAPHDDQELLTAREREVLGLIGNALSNKEIARQLLISDKTVKTHLHHIYVKLHKSGRYKAFLSNYPAWPASVSGEDPETSPESLR